MTTQGKTNYPTGFLLPREGRSGRTPAAPVDYIVDEITGCWVWQRPLGPHGYGQMTYQGKGQNAHRVAYQVLVGPIPAGRDVCHACDNRACVNPDHLYAGTRWMNMLDRDRQGRRTPPVGEDNGNSKLTAEHVREIHRLKRAGMNQYEIARRFGVEQPTVSLIVRGLMWAHEHPDRKAG